MRASKTILAAALLVLLGACDGAMFRSAPQAADATGGGYNVSNP